jgi:hypothetical protein
MARKFHGGMIRRKRRRKEVFVRFSRRASRAAAMIASEFKLWLLIGLGSIVVIVAGALLFAPYFDVREIHVRRQDPRIDPENIQQTLSPLFKQRLILVTRAQVTEMLQNVYPDIEKVDINKEYPSTLQVTVYVEPVAAEISLMMEIVGSGGVVTTTGSSMYSYVTKSGMFTTSPIKLSGAPLPKITVTDWGVEPQNRTQIFEEGYLQSMLLARDILQRDFGLTSVGITLYLRAKEFHIRTNKIALWFDLQTPLAVQFQRFREFLKALSLDQAKEYIDLRIADKIIYK